ncbi:AT-hook motif nuclear-localized protein 29-like [Apium graveolens]|uniref:AT-hook motif nuclear-localized protein 29-like n=1 Tax=Apium graveolens TaxID=4045 RepID=UPI003D797BD9
MENNNNPTWNSSQIVQQLLPPPSPHHSDSEINPQNNSSVGGGISSPKRRPPGRPRGSKNKPKHTNVSNCESPNTLKMHLLEVSSGVDIVETLNNYARQRGRGVCILNGNGMVSNVIIRQPATSSLFGGFITLPGAFELISITGAVLPPPAPPGSGSLSIFLSGGHGNVLGGNVEGPLIATGTVVLTLASFANAVFERIPVRDNEAVELEDAGSDAAAPRHPF